MACAKPLIVISGDKTPLYNFLSKKNCAELIVNNRNVNFINAIRKLAYNRELREELGNNGYKEIISNYSKEVVVTKYVNLLRKL
jgi:glycosyltransferase involved in cell wall biosynthesis